jgi:hypothetical protein
MRLAILFGFIWLLNGCAPIKIYDDPWCADAGVKGAECFNTLSNKEFSIDKYHWDQLRLGQICTATVNPGEGYKHIRAAIEKLCADSNRCTPEQVEEVRGLLQRMDSAQLRALQ